MTNNNTAPFQIALGRKGYNALSEEAIEAFGMSLEALAEEDPALTFRLLLDSLLNNVISTLPDASVTVYSAVDNNPITSDQDGDAARLAFQKRAKAISEDAAVIVQPFDVMVGIVKTETDEGGPILQFRVEPPNLAF